nr:hypothetical protein [Tanacetum cinerariifolium]
MYEEEDDDVAKELYGYLNVDQEDKDADMTNVEQGGADQHNASHESGFVHEEEDAHVTLTTVHDKTEGPSQSSSISSDFKSKLLNLDDLSSDINSLIDTSTVPPLPPPYLASKVKEAVDVAVRLQSKLNEEAEAENQEFFNQVDSTMKAIIKEISTMHWSERTTQKRGRDDQDKDEDPSNGSERGTKRRKSSKDAELSKGLKSNESKSSSSSKGTQSQPKSSGKSTQAEEPEFEVVDTKIQRDQGNESGHIDEEPNTETAPKHDWFQIPDKPPTPNRAWNKSKFVDYRPP